MLGASPNRPPAMTLRPFLLALAISAALAGCNRAAPDAAPQAPAAAAAYAALWQSAVAPSLIA